MEIKHNPFVLKKIAEEVTVFCLTCGHQNHRASWIQCISIFLTYVTLNVDFILNTHLHFSSCKPHSPLPMDASINTSSQTWGYFLLQSALFLFVYYTHKFSPLVNDLHMRKTFNNFVLSLFIMQTPKIIAHWNVLYTMLDLKNSQSS